jgi:hypothetical protein
MASMNRNKLKTYAPEARRDFIQAMTDRAAFYGLTASKTEPAVVRGDVAVIAGRDHPRAIADKRKKLEARVERDGFEQTMEAMAYTWFNRLVAIRFMELHGYMDHGYRVLSHPEGKQTPEILEHAEHVELPGLKKDRAIDLKLEGNKESELYRLLLTAQCNALHKAMPFLFERIDDETELLLPDNLLHSDSLIRKLVDGIDEDDWKEVEIIGWLYQFYISERKDEVIGKVVASADIPAATQLFTPNWIVKYLVQNTLGRQWLATYPNSALRAQMEYYIEPAEQTAEVAGQIKAITPESLDPEALTMLDPACGSCHILVEGYDLFKAIYLERGYRLRDIPALILQKNLFGLEIDDRAAQLGAFALMMKARADDRRVFEGVMKPNVFAFQNSHGLTAAAVTDALNAPIRATGNPREFLFEEIEEAETPLLIRKKLLDKGDVSKSDIELLLALFEQAKTFGSLLRLPSELAPKLPAIERRLGEVLERGDLMHASALALKPLLQQAALLTRQYDSVVANPPYMGRKHQCEEIKKFLKDEFQEYSTDLYAAFIRRCVSFSSSASLVAMITMDSWMSGEDFSSARSDILARTSVIANAHLGPRAFDEISGEVVQTCAFVLRNLSSAHYTGAYFRLTSPKTSDEKRKLLLCGATRFDVETSYFDVFPRRSMAYFATKGTREAFVKGQKLAEFAEAFTGLQTGDNEQFIRTWSEVDASKIAFGMTGEAAKASDSKWFPYIKGSEFRKWYGNQFYIVNWQHDGAAIRAHKSATVRNTASYFLKGLAYNNIAKNFSARLVDGGAIFDQKNSMFIAKDQAYLLGALGFLHTKAITPLLEVVAPKDFNPGSLKEIPVDSNLLKDPKLISNVDELVGIARKDWDSTEISWEFSREPLLDGKGLTSSIEESWGNLSEQRRVRLQRAKALEEQNNQIFIDAYGLGETVRADVDDAEISLLVPNRANDCKRLVSFVIGCIMGRYSLDAPGRIFAESKNKGFDPSRYKKFPADEDGIVPLLGTDLGIKDDATNRIVEFVRVAWPQESLEDNLRFISESLGGTAGEQPRDTIRRYLAAAFYKSHMSMYKKRPIYWLFSSGKQRAFQCLVYLHRYHEGSLSRMRTEYVVPLQGQIVSRVDQIESEKLKASSTSLRKKLQKEQDDLKRQQVELAAFEEKLKHFADQKISVDLDEGVKVNYGKFGDLLAEVDTITGGKDDE